MLPLIPFSSTYQTKPVDIRNTFVKLHNLSDGRRYTGMIDSKGKATDKVGTIYCTGQSKIFKGQQSNTIYRGSVVDGMPNGPGQLFNDRNVLIKEGIWKNWEVQNSESNAFPGPCQTLFPIVMKSGFRDGIEQKLVLSQTTAASNPSPLTSQNKNLQKYKDSVNGSEYNGEFDGNKFSGNILYRDGSRYFGSTINGLRYGPTGLFVGLNHTYNGPWVNDQPEGNHGVHISSLGKYVGQFRKGLFNGDGKFIYANGNVYIGNWNDGKRHGHGTFQTLEEGLYIIYIGNFKDDKFTGDQQQIFDTDMNFYYAGQTMDGNKHGKGIIKFDDGSRYEGEFVDDEMHGKGTYFYSDGSIYIGNFAYGDFDGKGEYTKVSSKKDKVTVFKGDFEEDNFIGDDQEIFYFEVQKGKLVQKAHYRGATINAKEFGPGGVCTYADGGKYTGYWKKGKFEGKGTYIWKDGSKYEGEFRNGIPNGDGLIILSNGKKYKGRFYNGYIKQFLCPPVIENMNAFYEMMRNAFV